MIAKSVRRVENSVEIVWSDDHRSLYETAYLRDHCPCVKCKALALETPPGAVPLPLSRPGSKLDIRKAAPVGNYALQLTFSDGHDKGIYTYDYLRTLCPCPSCAGAPREGL